MRVVVVDGVVGVDEDEGGAFGRLVSYGADGVIVARAASTPHNDAPTPTMHVPTQ
jgi:hypothetical protein